jgi:hypothetical protein
MKKLILLTIMVIIFGITIYAYSKEIDLSITLNGGYNKAIWKSGTVQSPTGTTKESSLIYGGSLQLKYIGWKYQPTFEVSYRQAKFDFSNWQQDATTKPVYIGLLAGVTKEFQDFSIYGLIGYANHKSNLSLTEKIPPLYHGRNISLDKQSHLFSWKIGVYKLWNVGFIKIGPEVSLAGYNPTPKFSACRKVKEWPIQPQMGLRVQW